MTEFTIKRVYDDPCEQDGWRVLIDRLWPRGLSKKTPSWTNGAKSLLQATSFARGLTTTTRNITSLHRATVKSLGIILH